MTWNLFLRHYDDGEYEFSDVNAALFSAMIDSQCNVTEPPTTLGKERYYRYLRVAARSEERSLRVLGAREEDGKRNWTERVVDSNDVDLRFSTLFDFSTTDGCFREFQYVYAIVVRSNAAGTSVGEALLVEANQSDVIDISPLVSPSKPA